MIRQEKIIAIMRNVGTRDCIETAKALYDGGIRLLEIPFFQGSDALEQTTESIRAVSRELGKEVVPGYGDDSRAAGSGLECRRKIFPFSCFRRKVDCDGK